MVNRVGPDSDIRNVRLVCACRGAGCTETVGVGNLHPWSSIDIASVVYTCGAMRHNDQIILPYAVSDTFSNFATIKISALMQAMKS